MLREPHLSKKPVLPRSRALCSVVTRVSLPSRPLVPSRLPARRVGGLVRSPWEVDFNDPLCVAQLLYQSCCLCVSVAFTGCLVCGSGFPSVALRVTVVFASCSHVGHTGPGSASLVLRVLRHVWCGYTGLPCGGGTMCSSLKGNVHKDKRSKLGPVTCVTLGHLVPCLPSLTATI